MKMFTQKEFDVFKVEGLDKRMAAVRQQIQPVFQELDDYFVKELAPLLGEELLIHIAQHRRRTANAPDFTWSAMGGDKRGYKKYPHFTLGITGNYLVMWLSFIDNPLNEKQMAEYFLEHPQLFENLPADFQINLDHTVNNYQPLAEADLQAALTRWRDVKKGEFQIGRVIEKDAIILKKPKVATAYMLESYQLLLPFYQATRDLSDKVDKN